MACEKRLVLRNAPMLASLDSANGMILEFCFVREQLQREGNV